MSQIAIFTVLTATSGMFGGWGGSSCPGGQCGTAMMPAATYSACSGGQCGTTAFPVAASVPAPVPVNVAMPAPVYASPVHPTAYASVGQRVGYAAPVMAAAPAPIPAAPMVYTTPFIPRTGTTSYGPAPVMSYAPIYRVSMAPTYGTCPNCR